MLATDSAESLCGSSLPTIDARVVFLTHYIPLYKVRVLQSIASAVRDFHILLSTPIEPNRHFEPDWTGLNVSVQDSLTLRRRWRHPSGGFDDTLYVHVPYDTGRRLRELKPDVVMSLELGARSLGAARYRRRNPDSRLALCTFMSEHTESGRGWLRRRLRKRLLHTADAVTYNGDSCRNYLKSFDIKDDRLFHFPYAADDRTTFKGPIDRCDQQTRSKLLCIGQLSERKGTLPFIEQMIQYASSRPQQQITVTFVGEGPLKDQAKSMATPDNLTLDFLGNVCAQDLPGVMLNHGLAVSPTLADEWLMTVNESMQAGLPFLGSVYAQAVTSLVTDNETGWQFDPHQSETLFRALDQYFGAPEQQINAMCQNARQRVRGMTPQWAAQGAIDTIRHVLGMSPASTIATQEITSQQTAEQETVVK